MLTAVVSYVFACLFFRDDDGYKRINIIPGTTVTVIDPRDEVLSFADREVAQALCYSMRQNGARFLLGEKVWSLLQWLIGTLMVGWSVKRSFYTRKVDRLSFDCQFSLMERPLDREESGITDYLAYAMTY